MLAEVPFRQRRPPIADFLELGILLVVVVVSDGGIPPKEAGAEVLLSVEQRLHCSAGCALPGLETSEGGEREQLGERSIVALVAAIAKAGSSDTGAGAAATACEHTHQAGMWCRSARCMVGTSVLCSAGGKLHSCIRHACHGGWRYRERESDVGGGSGIV